MQKVRRAGGNRAGGFPGAEVILDQLANGASRKRVGFSIDGRAPVREGAELQDGQGNKVGQITSGGFGPTLEAPVAMGYVSNDFAAIGTELVALVRNREISVTVTKMPMVEQRYHRG